VVIDYPTIACSRRPQAGAAQARRSTAEVIETKKAGEIVEIVQITLTGKLDGGAIKRAADCGGML
jgi:hypothetical protein